MWVKVDDGFPEHHKVLRAGELLGANGCGRVAAVWLEAMCYSNRHLTDGFISDAVARRFHLDKNPLEVIRVMAQKKVRLLEKKEGGWQIHDYHDYQPSKAEVEDKRGKERDRKRRVRGVSARTNDGLRADNPRSPHGQTAESHSESQRESAYPVPSRPGPAPEDQDQEQRPAGARHSLNRFTDENPRGLVKLAHSVFDDLDAGRPGSHGEPLTPDDVVEELKCRAAKAHIRYDGDRDRKALDSAEVQRRRRQESA